MSTRARWNGLAGRIWPAGRSLVTPELDEQKCIQMIGILPGPKKKWRIKRWRIGQILLYYLQWFPPFKRRVWVLSDEWTISEWISSKITFLWAAKYHLLFVCSEFLCALKLLSNLLLLCTLPPVPDRVIVFFPSTIISDYRLLQVFAISINFELLWLPAVSGRLRRIPTLVPHHLIVASP